jgi:hypothetical protein
MPRHVKRLNAVKVAALKKKGLYPDGDGLYLQVSATGSKSWIYRFKAAGRARDMGLGPLSSVPLAKARKLAANAREQRLEGLDPISERTAQRARQRLAEAQAVTFDQAAEAYVAAHGAGWRNAKHRAQWTSTLKAYASPVLGKLPVAAIDTQLVMKVLEPIWAAKTETASRVRGRLESVLAWATVQGMREGPNPAQWRHHLDKLLARPSRVKHVTHHPALPYSQLPNSWRGCVTGRGPQPGRSNSRS